MNVKLARSLNFSQRKFEHYCIPVESLSFRGSNYVTRVTTVFLEPL